MDDGERRMQPRLWVLLVIMMLAHSMNGLAETTLTLTDNDDVAERINFQENFSSCGSIQPPTSDYADGTGDVWFVKWDISAIPSAQQIVSASMYLNITTDSNNTLDVWHVENQTWRNSAVNQCPDTLCGDGAVCGELWDMFTTKEVSDFQGTLGGPAGAFHTFTGLNSSVIAEYDAGLNNVSFAFNNTGLNASAQYRWSFAISQNHGNHLNITYKPITINYTENNSRTPVTYDPDVPSVFNITWTHDYGTIDTVNIETNHSGSDVNYSMTSLGGGVYSYNVTLGIGDYHWKSWAEGSNSAINQTITYNFSIAQGSPLCHLNVTIDSTTTTDQNRAADSAETVTVHAYCDDDAATLYYDNNSVSNPHVLVHGVGQHTYIANSTGNANYTANTTGGNITLTVTAATGGGGGGGGGSEIVIVEGDGFVIINPAKEEKTASLYCAPGGVAPEEEFTVFNTIGENKEFLFVSEGIDCVVDPPSVIVPGTSETSFVLKDCACPLVDQKFDLNIIQGELTETIEVELLPRKWVAFLLNSPLLVVFGLIFAIAIIGLFVVIRGVSHANE